MTALPLVLSASVREILAYRPATVVNHDVYCGSVRNVATAIVKAIKARAVEIFISLRAVVKLCMLRCLIAVCPAAGKMRHGWDEPAVASDEGGKIGWRRRTGAAPVSNFTFQRQTRRLSYASGKLQRLLQFPHATRHRQLLAVVQYHDMFAFE